MRKLLRALILSGAVVGLMMLFTGVVVASTVVQSGVLMVQVHEKSADGVRFTAPVPAGLLELGTNLAFLAEDELESVRRELEPWRPAIEASLDELQRAGSFTIVDVATDSETVHIAKEGRSLVIDVDSEDAEVFVSIPLPLVDRVFRAVAG